MRAQIIESTAANCKETSLGALLTQMMLTCCHRLSAALAGSEPIQGIVISLTPAQARQVTNHRIDTLQARLVVGLDWYPCVPSCRHD